MGKKTAVKEGYLNTMDHVRNGWNCVVAYVIIIYRPHSVVQCGSTEEGHPHFNNLPTAWGVYKMWKRDEGRLL